MFSKLFKPAPQVAVAEKLFVAIMQQTRLEPLYVDFEAPDTFEGRFEMAALFGVLTIRRLQSGDAAARDLAQRVFDRLFKGFDEALRDVGIGDMTIAKRMRKLGESFYGRAGAYEGPIATGDLDALAEALARNVWRADAADAPQARRLAIYVLQVAGALDAQDFAALSRGEIAFPPPSESSQHVSA